MANPLAGAAVVILSAVTPRSRAVMRFCMLLAKSRMRTEVTSEIIPRPYCAAAPDSCRSCATSILVPAVAGASLAVRSIAA
jgi:hypothetical protein